MLDNDKNIRIDIRKICGIFRKNLSDLTEEDWKDLKTFKKKLTMSSAFAHKFCKKSNEIESFSSNSNK